MSCAMGSSSTSSCCCLGCCEGEALGDGPALPASDFFACVFSPSPSPFATGRDDASAAKFTPPLPGLGTSSSVNSTLVLASFAIVPATSFDGLAFASISSLAARSAAAMTSASKSSANTASGGGVRLAPSVGLATIDPQVAEVSLFSPFCPIIAPFRRVSMALLVIAGGGDAPVSAGAGVGRTDDVGSSRKDELSGRNDPLGLNSGKGRADGSGEDWKADHA
mmetsp:Transcript_18349/g.52946  ORF Transcript_18349/g.52946 Transcript_18349/m.52946 type:complete len:222 (+) Transcript_18349:851-1516(+)